MRIESGGGRLPHRQTRRALVLLLLLGAVVLIVASSAARAWIEAITATAASRVEQHAVAGLVVFLLLSMVSAMLAFFSTAALVPVAVSVWGKGLTLLILWLGWLGGGVLSYWIGRHLGRRVVSRIISEERLRSFEAELGGLVGFPLVFLVQLALPSEVPGYVLGTLRYDPKTYFAALALAELPFALGSVYLGESFLHGNLMLLSALGVAGIALSWCAATLLSRRLHSGGGGRRHADAKPDLA